MCSAPSRPRTGPHGDRLAQVVARARSAGVDHLVLTPGEDLLYLTGERLDSHERLTALVVPVGEAGSVDGRVLLQPALECTERSRATAARVGAELRTWTDGEDAVGLLAALLPGSREFAVSAACPALHLVPLLGLLDAHPRTASAFVDPVRAVKTAEELGQLAEAAQRIDAVHARMGEFLRVGRTEREVAERVAAAIVEEGLDHAEFVIVASGPNGADPHHEVSNRVIERGDVVVVDIGGPLASGYHSDCTRTYVLGEPAPEVAETYPVLQEAQHLAREAVRPGRAIGEVDAAAREHLEAAGLGEYFTHRTGHGIGLGLHEPPFAAPGETTVLAEGMTFSIEPGVYLPGRWGARLEDIVAVTADGCLALDDGPRGLTRLDG